MCVNTPECTATCVHLHECVLMCAHSCALWGVLQSNTPLSPVIAPFQLSPKEKPAPDPITLLYLDLSFGASISHCL